MEYFELLDDDKSADEISQYFGRGLDTGLGVILSPVLTGPVVQEAYMDESTSAFFEVITSQHEYSERVARSASASGLFKKFSANGASSVERFYSANSYSLYLIARARIPRLTKYLNLNSTSIKVSPAIKQTMRRYSKQPYEILREIGDEIITKAVTVSELLIVIEITTSSEEDRKVTANNLSANYLGVVAGNGSFSSIRNKLGVNRRISFTLHGDIASGFISTTNPDEAEQLLLNFLQDPQPARLVGLESTPISTINQLKGQNIPRNIVDGKELIARSSFASQLNARYLDLSDWKNDIRYVLSNPTQFDSSTTEMAKFDMQECQSQIMTLEIIAKAARTQFLTTGRNGEMINLNRIPSFSGRKYSRQHQPSAPTSPPAPRPVREIFYPPDHPATR